MLSISAIFVKIPTNISPSGQDKPGPLGYRPPMTIRPIFEGCIPALMTPCDEYGTINYDELSSSQNTQHALFRNWWSNWDGKGTAI